MRVDEAEMEGGGGTEEDREMKKVDVAEMGVKDDRVG